MEKISRRFTGFFPFKDELVGSKGESSSGRLGSDRLDREAKDRLSRLLQRDGWANFIFAFYEQEEIGPKMLARIAKHTGLKPEDL